METINRIIVKDITISGSQLEVDYTVEGDISKYINVIKPYFLDYSEDISQTPKSVAIIPFVANMLPAIWLADAQLIVDELDSSFYNSIPWIKRGYIDMYPQLKFRGELVVDKLIENNYEPTDKTITLFSGGADSNSTLVSHITEDLTLLTVWGADVWFDDEKGWDNVKNDTINVCNQFGLTPAFVKSTFKMNLNYDLLNDVVKITNDNYWHGLQHGIGLISHFAPLVWKHKYKQCYIPASPCLYDEDFETCASAPTIDEKMKICGCPVIHDGYELNRQERINNVIDYANDSGKKFVLRVCFESTGGKNCCVCEKCLRTMFAILVHNADPKDFGFEYEEEKFADFINAVKNYPLPDILVNIWKGIQADYVNQKTKQTTQHNITQHNTSIQQKLDWLLDWDFETNRALYVKFLKKKSRRKLFKKGSNLYKFTHFYWLRGKK